MKKYLYSLRTDLKFSEPAQVHTFLLRATPFMTMSQEAMRASLTCSPSCVLSPYKDGFGNVVHAGYIREKHSQFVFCSTGEIAIDSYVKDTSEPAPYYLYNYPLTKMDEQLRAYFEDNVPSGNVDEVVNFWLTRISCDFRYEKGVTTTKTTASEAWAIGCGVCQDYSHILISILRAQGIPCRYIAGLLVGEGATHAWVEYYDGKYWVGVDPTHNSICNDSYMKLSQGPDFSACSLEKGVFLGGGEQFMFTKSALIEL